MITVTISVEQEDDEAGPVTTVWKHRVAQGGTGRFLADALQTAVLDASRRVVEHVGEYVDLRVEGRMIEAAGSLVDALKDG